ncbi:S9 family peptidase [Sphingomonas sp.]|uniref:S9 family peptidase n=1 Tax=Sphingomonas sp. TaxID=28214 RepID=UPI0025FA94E9|nr:S9 family peptidase [Sphingomonas sp.]
MADKATPQKLTLERLFASPALGGAAPRALKLSPDGTLLTSLRPRADDRERYDLWAVDTRTGVARMLVDSAKIGNGAQLSEAEKMQRERARIGGTKGIVAYDWAPDGKSLLVPLDGDLFIATLDGKVRRITATQSTELDATISPRGGFVSFVRDQNLFVADLATGSERRLTRGGGDALSWGLAEFVAQEEMDRTKGAWWAPDDKRLAVARVDESKVAIVSRAAIGADGTKVYDQRYPRAGAANAVVDLFVINVDGSGQVRVDLGTNPDIYLARVNWSPDGKTLYVQRESRDQKTLDLLKVDPATGKSTVVFSEHSKTWLNLHDDFHALRDGSILWSSERDGFSHLYRWHAGKWAQLTRGPWMVKTVVGVDETKGLVYFTGNRDTPIDQNLYSVPLQGGAVTLLTENGWWNNAVMSRDASRIIVTRSNPNQPEQTYLADATGQRLSWVEENRVDGLHPYAPYLAEHVPTVFGSLKAADGSVLHYKLLKPRLATGQRAPVFMQVYGGPGAGRQVTDAWGGVVQQYLVQQGWVVFSIDGRGTPDRGAAFEGQIYRAMSSVEVDDQIAGVNWLKKQDFVNPAKIAVYGWSYGGYMALRLLERAPGVFAAGVSGAPVTRWELYDTHYTERYMGNPTTEAAAYQRSDALPNAGAIADPLLLVHGMADDNVVFENSTALMARLQESAHPFETMVYPGQTHRVAGPGISAHLWKTILGFLDRQVVNKEQK